MANSPKRVFTDEELLANKGKYVKVNSQGTGYEGGTGGGGTPIDPSPYNSIDAIDAEGNITEDPALVAGIQLNHSGDEEPDKVIIQNAAVLQFNGLVRQSNDNAPTTDVVFMSSLIENGTLWSRVQVGEYHLSTKATTLFLLDNSFFNTPLYSVGVIVGFYSVFQVTGAEGKEIVLNTFNDSGILADNVLDGRYIQIEVNGM